MTTIALPATRDHKDARNDRFFRWFNDKFDRGTEKYQRGVRRTALVGVGEHGGRQTDRHGERRPVDIVGNAIKVIDSALTVVNDQRAKYGAIQNRFESAIANLQVASENQNAARSRIMDADFAAETAALSRAQILQQAGNAMVAQANQLPQQVLSLLQR